MDYLLRRLKESGAWFGAAVPLTTESQLLQH
jgi:hypothetical protein